MSKARPRSDSLGPWTAGALVAGSMLGIGIFIGPPQMAAELTSRGWMLALWALGGAAALCGALSIAELAAMRPESGGDYVYLREAYGPGVAAAVGWLQIAAIFPGSIATMAAAAATYQLPVLLGDAARGAVSIGPWEIPVHAVWAGAIVVGLTLVNQWGLRPSGRLQFAVTAVPLLLLLMLGLRALFATTGADAHVADAGPAPAAASLAAAYLPVYFAYAGWNAALYVAGDVRNPTRNVPLALGAGTALVTLLYLLLCAGFLAVLTPAELADAGEAGSAVAGRLAGATGVVWVTAAIFLAILGSINGTIMTGAPIIRAMALRGDFARAAAPLGARGTPIRALWIQAAWAGVLVTTRRVDQLLAYTTAAMLVTGTLTVLAPMLLRRRDPTRARPYRIPLYPATPLLYAFSSLGVLVLLAQRGDASVWLALVWFVVVVGVHRALRRPTEPTDATD